MDIDKRLHQLNKRRVPNSTMVKAALSRDSATYSEYQPIVESYQTLAQGKYVKYAIGAMQPVNHKYTSISYREGERVIKCLMDGLGHHSPDFELQGSLPMDLHLRHNSDVDILALHGQFHRYTSPAIRTYSPYIGRGMVFEVEDLRNDAIRILGNHFPAATVTPKDKSICITGGSLLRDIDVVPSVWLDTIAYQYSNHKNDRGVEILDRSKWELVPNSPFKFRYEIDSKDRRVGGNLKKVIRLLKTLMKDSEQENRLSSYDIASMVWNMADNLLLVATYHDLVLLDNARTWLFSLLNDESLRILLNTPDGSRKVFDNDSEKKKGLQSLYSDLDSLCLSIYRELTALSPYSYKSNYDQATLRGQQVILG